MAASDPSPAAPGSAAGSRPLGQAAAQGVLWLMAGSLTARISGFLSQIVLAWMLLPSDFGKVGLALTVVNLAGTLVNFGVDDVLLQRQRTIRFWIRSAFWLSLGLGLCSLIVIAVAAQLGAAVFDSPDLVGLIWIQAAAIPLAALATVPAVMIRAALDFRFLALFTTFEVLAIQIATVLLAWSGAGAYSFVIPVPILALVKAAVFWRRARPVFASRAKLSQFRHFASNGVMISGNRLLIEAVLQGDYIVLGLIAAPDVVGLYFLAFRLSALPVRMLAGNFQNVMFPTLAKLGGDPERQRQAALDAARLLAFIVMPACFLQAALAEPVLSLLFGTKWEGAIPLAQILSIGLPFDAVSWVAGALLSARGEFRRSFAYACVLAPFFFVVVALGGLISAPLGVAAGVSLYYMLGPTTMSWLVFRSPTISAGAMVRLYGLPAGIAALAVGSAYSLSLASVMAGHLVARSILISALAAILYTLLLRVLAPHILEQIVARLPAEWRATSRSRLGGLLRGAGWTGAAQPAAENPIAAPTKSSGADQPNPRNVHRP